MNINKGQISAYLKKKSDVTTLFVLLLSSVVIISVLDSNFYSLGNFQSMAFQLPEIGILTLAMMISMLTGGINLSVIASTNLSCIVMGIILKAYSGLSPAGMPFAIVLAILAGLACATAVGLLNGYIITGLNVPPIIATLGTKLLVDGLSIVITKGYIISDYPKAFLKIGNSSIVSIPIPFLILIVCAAFLAIVLKKTPLGQSIYMFGSNPVATKFSGINTGRMLIKTYLISNLFTGIAAVIMLARFNSASAGYSNSYLLLAVLISVLGGTNPNGGAGKVWTIVLATVVLQIVSNGLNLLGATQFLTLAIWGVLLLVVIGIRSMKKAN